jgi:hypothetical protein
VDGDGISDACDCASGDGGAFAVPGEVADLRFAGETVLIWNPMAADFGSGTVYDVIRGDLAALRDGDPVAAAACVGTVSTAVFEDTASPDPCSGDYYLAAARNGCGAGGFGADSAGTPRAHEVCP